MTISAPKTRRGKLSFVLALLAALVAAGGLFLWSQQATADISSTSVSFTDDAGATINAGANITYTATVTQTGVVGGTTTNTRFTVTLDFANIQLATVTSDAAAPWQTGAECTYTPGTGVASCIDATGPVASDTVTIVALVKPGGDNDVDVPTNCFVDDDGAGSATCTLSNIATVAINAGVTITPASGTRLVGQSENDTIHFGAFYTCGSDNFATNGAAGNDGTRDCAAGDLTVTGPGTVSGWPPADTALGTAQDFTITVTCTGAGTVNLSLANRYEGVSLEPTGSEDAGDDVSPPPVTASKNCQNLATAGDAHLQHVDIDNATEDVAPDGTFDAGTGEDYPLTVQDDPDDATGSLHTACLISASLGAADQANITWSITPTSGSLATVSPAPSGTKVILNLDGDGALNDDSQANCVQWRSGGVGGQNITATYTPTGEVIGWDSASGNGVGDPPLIKEWNDIDVTSIVQATGDVGDTLEGNTEDLASWLDLATGGTCVRDEEAAAALGEDFCGDRANVDGLTLTVSGTQFSNGNILASGRSFIDYVFGDHADFAGAVDGVEQTYTVSGDCGSVRLEDPVTGTVIFLDPVAGGFPASATILSSDKGVGFQILPTFDGDVVTDIFNSDCQSSESTTVTITSQEDVQLNSILDTAPTETITIHWTAGPGPNKHTLLAWAGMRVVLEQDWSEPDGSCPWFGQGGPVGQGGPIGVRYMKAAESPGTMSPVPFTEALQQGPDYIIVGLGEDCISRVIYESENQGQVDVTAHIVAFEGPFVVVLSPEADFVVYYMKLEDVTLGIVPGAREFHNDGDFTADTPPVSDPANDVASIDENVSADELVRVLVRGWVEADNCPVRAAGADSNGGLLPANRCIFPGRLAAHGRR